MPPESNPPPVQPPPAQVDPQTFPFMMGAPPAYETISAEVRHDRERQESPLDATECSESTQSDHENSTEVGEFRENNNSDRRNTQYLVVNPQPQRETAF